ncbi:breast carcinoma-amplified sequence 1 isoform X3 [Dicentrarchus labrax]|uniref:breast carcinoma-amplified sequence 1 isoform X3 n=1 Tax=Dicentrarchus labrax TaxID=13489 RepID=UPI0021F60035|nr:breast carcinoma-amplified sequence 1 isoform X3 [Dicentrarchus labrax]
MIIVEAPSSELITIEELIEDTLNFPDDEVKPEDVITTDEKAEVSEDVRADVGPETVKEAEPSPVIVKDDAEVIPEAAIKALSQELELSVITPQEPAVDNGILLGEEVISATTFVPLSGDREASLTIAEEPIKTLAEEMNEEVIEALLNEFDVPPMDTTRERVEVTNIFEISHIKNCVPEGENVKETEPEIAAKPECDPNKSIIDGEIVAEEIVPLEFSFSLPKVVADCIEVVFAAVSESTDFADVNTSAQSVDEVITEDHDDGARDMSADVVLIEIAEPEALAEEMNKEAIKTLLKEFDVPPMGATEESESCVFVQEELVEENVVPSEELLEDSNKGTAVVAVKEPTDFNPVISEEPVEESASLLEPLVLVVILETREDEDTEDTHETHNYRDVLVAIEENSEDCQIDTSYEAVAECVQVVLETIVEENITVDVATGCDLVTSELVAPEIIAEGEQEEHESNVNSTDSTQSAEIIEDMEALLVRLQSACTSVVLESAYRLGGLNISSLGYSINVTIHVTPKTEQQ